MRQDLIDSNKELIFEVTAEIAVAFGENKSNYVVGKSKVKKTDVVAVREKEKVKSIHNKNTVTFLPII